MSTQKLIGVFASVHGNRYKNPPKFALQWKMGHSHERFDVYRVRYKIDVVRDLVPLLESASTNFLANFEAVDKNHYKTNGHRFRRYVSTDVSELFPGESEGFCKRNSFAYEGYHIGTNSNAGTILDYVREMCEACSVTFGSWRDLKL